MKSFIARRIRNGVALKIAIPAVLILGVFMFIGAAISTILSPIESVQNAVTGFLSGDESSAGDTDFDLRACLAIPPTSLAEVVGTVPPHTDLPLAQSWIALRVQEIARSSEPAYASILDFAASPTGQQASATTVTVPESGMSAYDLAATAGIIDLIQRGIATAPTIPHLRPQRRYSLSVHA
ncbi:hypothetical protein GS531_23100 [Rhodococcus hoagii]|nr:hypothetical protein [Prescottella equi]